MPIKSGIAFAGALAGMLLGPIVALAATDQDTDRSQPKTFVKDSAITAKMKSKLAAEHPSSLANIHVDTDAEGVVWLSGHAPTHQDIDRAVSIARETEHVKTVHNTIKIKKED